MKSDWSAHSYVAEFKHQAVAAQVMMKLDSECEHLAATALAMIDAGRVAPGIEYRQLALAALAVPITVSDFQRQNARRKRFKNLAQVPAELRVLAVQRAKETRKPSLDVVEDVLQEAAANGQKVTRAAIHTIVREARGTQGRGRPRRH